MNEKIQSTEAKQGRRGLPILMIMIVSIALALIVWFFVAIYGQAIAPEEDGTATISEQSNGDLTVQEVEQKPASPAIEDPAEAPDASTSQATPDQAPGGTTGQEEPAEDFGTDSGAESETAPAN
ncbi:hypothetical protein [Notoacmeibacter ruber]|uniref:Uncharacterized protein n=1 Tax=Notoacmeibacter ruber TaxID=2670375 RepID=A0A3L7JD32_9HYPH|nr:hypothetical protein [Notoacmeibacter ruber]RLQ88215.1 hypothetical protein D8780_08370 [Notoacmeibacter ruber]